MVFKMRLNIYVSARFEIVQPLNSIQNMTETICGCDHIEPIKGLGLVALWGKP